MLILEQVRFHLLERGRRLWFVRFLQRFERDCTRASARHERVGGRQASESKFQFLVGRFLHFSLPRPLRLPNELRWIEARSTVESPLKPEFGCNNCYSLASLPDSLRIVLSVSQWTVRSFSSIGRRMVKLIFGCQFHSTLEGERVESRW